MVQFNLALKEINCKVVYFGPGLSGKTTNLEVVHQKAPEASRGVLSSIATESDRTLFFDFMPLNLGMVGGMKTKFQLYTVPGQVYYNSTRKLVLRGADGVVFVADSHPDKMGENLESLQNLEDCLREQGRSLADTPHVIQFNKRDLPEAAPVEDLARALNRYGAPVVEATASQGAGVIETFKALSVLVLQKVKALSEERSGFQRAGPAKPATSGKVVVPPPLPVALGGEAPRPAGLAIQRNAPPMPPSHGVAPAAQFGGHPPPLEGASNLARAAVALRPAPPQMAPSLRGSGAPMGGAGMHAIGGGYPADAGARPIVGSQATQRMIVSSRRGNRGVPAWAVWIGAVLCGGGGAALMMLLFRK